MSDQPTDLAVPATAGSLLEILPGAVVRDGRVGLGEQDPQVAGIVPAVESPEEGSAGSPRSGRQRDRVQLWVEYDVETGVALRGRL